MPNPSSSAIFNHFYLLNLFMYFLSLIFFRPNLRSHHLDNQHQCEQKCCSQLKNYDKKTLPKSPLVMV